MGRNYYSDFDWPVLFKIPSKVARKTDAQSLQFKIRQLQLQATVKRFLFDLHLDLEGQHTLIS